MNDTLALPPRLVIRDLMLTAFTQKARVFLIFFVIMALSVVIAVQIQPNYKVKSTLLVLMGTEYSFRPAAGQQFTNSGGVDAEQILRTEASILTSDDLHRSVIREIGIEKMYPKLLEKPGTDCAMVCRYAPLHDRYARYHRTIDRNRSGGYDVQGRRLVRPQPDCYGR